jgi:hypothetical protein
MFVEPYGTSSIVSRGSLECSGLAGRDATPRAPLPAVHPGTLRACATIFTAGAASASNGSGDGIAPPPTNVRLEGRLE